MAIIDEEKIPAVTQRSKDQIQIPICIRITKKRPAQPPSTTSHTSVFCNIFKLPISSI